MKHLPTAALAASLSLLLAPAAVPAWAQSTAAEAPKTRAQVRIDRDEFMRTHTWDSSIDNWVLKHEFEAPEGHMSRAEVVAERERFLKVHRWDSTEGKWVPLGTQPRELSALSRDQVKRETIEFMRTHEWDNEHSIWHDKAMPRKPRS